LRAPEAVQDEHTKEGPMSQQDPEEYHGTEESAVESEETGTTYDAMGEPETTPHDAEIVGEEDASNPNAASSAGLAGDMGVSSEWTGPADETGTEGTGTVGTAVGRTHGTKPTTGGTAHSDLSEEENTAEVPGHDTDLDTNPGHSHG
jgi:hypothetical protein